MFRDVVDGLGQVSLFLDHPLRHLNRTDVRVNPRVAERSTRFLCGFFEPILHVNAERSRNSRRIGGRECLTFRKSRHRERAGYKNRPHHRRNVQRKISDSRRQDERSSLRNNSKEHTAKIRVREIFDLLKNFSRDASRDRN